ncbi:cytochrome b N-terminal domain-containing protein [Bradyrhizobium sp. 186]|uniref:cytochrome b n=1 Tax=Bradyrhizobium sp. 186 TaxID=2782654 RepID=UPI0020012952|nr:cytochrome b N-terminal domain-containing protein [Bradyrhizobium sp. 186]UPK37159.1 cytochrome b N-terminal domain-containing protein [Bradyrhizobium sp. 186]
MTTQGIDDHPGSTSEFSNPVVRWIDCRLPIFTFLRHELHDYPAPRNLNYLWNFGSLAGIVLLIMIATGIALAMNYTPTVNGAFNSVEHIMRDVNYGWLIRYLHTTGASMFFAAVYIHIFRGLYYGSYKAPRELLWIMGVAILLLMMATAFFGYTLPWGQMSFWGATVITNLFSAIPLVGDGIVTWLLGGFGVGNATLNRFYALHYLLPFVIVAVVLLHLVALHRFGSNNPDGIEAKNPEDTLAFHPYYTVKDLLGLAVFLLVFGWFVFYEPGALLNPDNSIPANPGVTPPEIVPEWYLLPYYAILKSVPNKLLGVAAMAGSILVLFVVPWLDPSPVRSARFRPVFRVFFWILVVDCVLLVFAGGNPPQGMWLVLSRLGAAYYFLHFLVVLPLVGRFERPRPLPVSIKQPVLATAGGSIAVRDINGGA